MNAGGVAASWDGGEQKKTRSLGVDYKLPKDKQLPDIYLADTTDFSAGTGRVFVRPQPAPRSLESGSGKMLGLFVISEIIGIGIAVLGFALMPTDSFGSLRIIVGVVGVLIALVANIALFSELPRMSMYTQTSFIPGILVYGSVAKFKEVVGEGGILPMQSKPVKSLGEGGASKLMKGHKQLLCPHEMVGLHINRGSVPEIIPVEWDAVREFVRGDIVWFNMKTPLKFIFFHKLYPYCPNVRADRPTRDEIYTTLRVGTIKKIALPSRNNMGVTKTFNVNTDGQIVSNQQPAQNEGTGVQPQTVKLAGPASSKVSDEPSTPPASSEGRFGPNDTDPGFGDFN